MPTFTPSLLAEWTGGHWGHEPRVALTGFTVDTRTITAGQVFVALRTERRDGHDFLDTARAAGAGAALVSRLNPAVDLPQLVVADPLVAFQAIARAHRRLFTGPVIGISGSCGKTSTKDLLALLLGGPGAGVLATEGNLNNHLGVPLTLTRLDPAEHRFAVVEAGISGPGEMDVLAGMIEPDISITTLIGPAHLLELGGLEGVAREKSRLGAAVRPAGMAVFPGQCAAFSAFRDLSVPRMVLEPAEVIRPEQPPRDVVYYTTTQRDDSTAVALAYGLPPPLTFTFRKVSQGMAQNAALAICAALWLGVSAKQIQERLQAWGAARWRGEIIRSGERLYYVDCYNANPASMRDALQNFDSIAPASRPRLYLLGCMEELGIGAAAFHFETGAALRLRSGDRAVVVGGEAASYRDGLFSAGAAAAQVELCSDAASLAPLVSSWDGSVFVKGSRKYQLEKALGCLVDASHTH